MILTAGNMSNGCHWERYKGKAIKVEDPILLRRI